MILTEEVVTILQHGVDIAKYVDMLMAIKI